MWLGRHIGCEEVMVEGGRERGMEGRMEMGKSAEIASQGSQAWR